MSGSSSPGGLVIRPSSQTAAAAPAVRPAIRSARRPGRPPAPPGSAAAPSPSRVAPHTLARPGGSSSIRTSPFEVVFTSQVPRHPWAPIPPIRPWSGSAATTDARGTVESERPPEPHAEHVVAEDGEPAAFRDREDTHERPHGHRPPRQLEPHAVERTTAPRRSQPQAAAASSAARCHGTNRTSTVCPSPSRRLSVAAVVLSEQAPASSRQETRPGSARSRHTCSGRRRPGGSVSPRQGGWSARPAGTAHHVSAHRGRPRWRTGPRCSATSVTIAPAALRCSPTGPSGTPSAWPGTESGAIRRCGPSSHPARRAATRPGTPGSGSPETTRPT